MSGTATMEHGEYGRLEPVHVLRRHRGGDVDAPLVAEEALLQRTRDFVELTPGLAMPGRLSRAPRCEHHSATLVLRHARWCRLLGRFTAYSQTRLPHPLVIEQPGVGELMPYIGDSAIVMAAR